MIPREANGGRSFKGAFLYYMHDKDALTRKRVAWTHTENMITEDPDKAWKVMAYTALSSERLKEASGISRVGRKLEYPVFSFSLAWHPEQDPDRHEMTEVAQQAIAAMGMEEHEALIVAHRDTPHPHLHVILNRVHPITGKAANNGNTWKKFSTFAHQLEREGGKIYCPQREENQQMKQQNKNTKYCDPVVAKAWMASENGQAFKQELEANGYQLAKGRKRIVVVDAHGKIINPLRHLTDVKSREFDQKVADLDLSTLSDADEAAKSVEQLKTHSYDQYQNYVDQAATVINRMQDRHIEEHSELLTLHFKKIHRTERELTESYEIPTQKQQIQDLRTSIVQCGFFKKLLRVDRSKQQKLDALEANLANAQMRMTERLEHLHQEKDRAVAKLRDKQLNERVDLNKILDRRRPPDHATRMITRNETMNRENHVPEPSPIRNYGLSR